MSDFADYAICDAKNFYGGPLVAVQFRNIRDIYERPITKDTWQVQLVTAITASSKEYLTEKEVQHAPESSEYELRANTVWSM